jgi:hypothetical protein
VMAERHCQPVENQENVRDTLIRASSRGHVAAAIVSLVSPSFL